MHTMLGKHEGKEKDYKGQHFWRRGEEKKTLLSGSINIVNKYTRFIQQ